MPTAPGECRGCEAPLANMVDVGDWAQRVLLGLRPLLEPVLGFQPEQRSNTLKGILEAERHEGSVPKEQKWADDFESDLLATRPKLRPTRAHGGGTRIIPNEAPSGQADVIHQELLAKVEAKRRGVVLARARRERMRMGLIDEDERVERAALLEARRRAKPAAVMHQMPAPEEELQRAGLSRSASGSCSGSGSGSGRATGKPRSTPPPSAPPSAPHTPTSRPPPAAAAASSSALLQGEPPPEVAAAARRELGEEYLRAEALSMAVLDARREAQAAVERVGVAVSPWMDAVSTYRASLDDAVSTYRAKAWELVAGRTAEVDGTEETHAWEEPTMAGPLDDRALRKAAAQAEPAWRGCGQRPGLQIWRVEQFKVVPWPVCGGGAEPSPCSRRACMRACGSYAQRP